MVRPLVVAVVLAAISAMPGMAETMRQLDAHQHGHGTLNMAVEGKTLHVELEVPGADIVGFEYAAESDDDKAKIEAAKTRLAEPSTLFLLPDAAGCKVTSADVSLVGEEEAGHDAAKHGEHDVHDKDAGKAERKDDEDEGAHSEFHAEYAFACANTKAIATVRFPYFEIFPNAEKLAVTLITEEGQKAYEVNRETAVIDIRGMM